MTSKFTQRPLAIATASILVSVLFSSVTYAQKGPRSGDRERGNSLEQRFQSLDSSGDEVLSLDEFTANTSERAENKFNRKDTDEDGFLSFEEATTNRRGEATDHSEIAQDIVDCVAALTEDNDTIIVPETSDFSSPEERFNAVDTSGDGLLSLEEVQDNALNKVSSAFESMDTDASGDVSYEEFESHNQQRKATRQAIRNCINELENDSVV
ncbi:EF-hand domain-containing protein [Planctobacterium marinum]|uniref:EF-hand domain-containing protein n=1 Tax=Planctobacterium marinum TaxID=1631968 RepID=A0AA48KRR1_9ALTE|nr:hypothetical protein MACH26_12100 [Planctobacterium marinum]